MTKVLVDLEDEETVIVRIERCDVGLAFDELDDEYEDRGLKIGVCHTLELSLRPQIARQLREALNREAI